MAAQDDVEDDRAALNLADAHERLLTDNSIQFELPPAIDYVQGRQPTQSGPGGHGPQSDPSGGPGQPPPLDPSAGGPPAQAPPLDLPPPGGGGLDGLMHVFLWIAAGIALAILLYWIFTFFRDRKQGNEPGAKKERRKKQPRENWRPAKEPAQQLLDEADVLASQGRYDEAAHLLLHRSIGEIDAHRPDLVRPALTSRDIAGHPLLPPQPAAAFARIAALVERSLFACRPLRVEDWHDCRAAYTEFAFADGWRG